MTLSSLRSSKTSSSKRNRQKTAGIRRYTGRFSRPVGSGKQRAAHRVDGRKCVLTAERRRQQQRQRPPTRARFSVSGRRSIFRRRPTVRFAAAFFHQPERRTAHSARPVARQALPAAGRMTQTGRSHGNASTTAGLQLPFSARAQKNRQLCRQRRISPADTAP